MAALITFLSATHYEVARLLCSGKIVDVSRREHNGWSVGTVLVDPFSCGGGTISIEIQNENLVAEQGWPRYWPSYRI